MDNQEAIDVMFNELKCIDRNDGIHCDRKCESCDLVMDVEIIREAYNMAISALQAQDSPKPTAESVQNVQNEDLISRKAAIDAECEVCQIAPKKERGHNCTYYVHGCKEIECLRELPSAQPEPCKDAVSREAAIDVAENAFVRGLLASPDIRRLPSAQPEPQWILVAERLPEEGQSILVTADGWRMVAIIRTFFKDMHKDIIAWMPLPEPYKEERRIDEDD